MALGKKRRAFRLIWGIGLLTALVAWLTAKHSTAGNVVFGIGILATIVGLSLGFKAARSEPD